MPRSAITRALTILLAIAACSALVTSSALADSVTTDPSSNFQIGNLPAGCYSQPLSATCTNDAVAILNQARASLGQPAYALPSNFDSLTPAQQVFVLTNLDRVQYGLTPVPGLTDVLDSDAAQGVQSDNDPTPSASNYYGFTSNWAGGFVNMPMAYAAWMYDDGPGSGNLDCTAQNSSGCWGHRHDVLWHFDSSGALAMGAAAGQDSSGSQGYAMLLFEGNSSYRPTYSYTWTQALGAGAGGGAPASNPSGGSQPSPSSPATPVAPATTQHHRASRAQIASRVALRVHDVRVTGHRVSFKIVAPVATTVRCKLMRWRGGRWVRGHWRRCGSSMNYRHVARGHYRIMVTADASHSYRTVRVH